MPLKDAEAGRLPDETHVLGGVKEEEVVLVRRDRPDHLDPLH
jgi:hypothetical protein